MSTATDLRHELTLLVLSRYPLVVIESAEEAKTEELVTRVAADLGLPLLFWSASTGLVRAGGKPFADTRDPDRALARLFAMEGMEGEVLAVFQDLHPFFDRPEIGRRLRDAERDFARGRSTLILTGAQIELPQGLAAARLAIALPSFGELLELVGQTAAELAGKGRVRVELTAEETEALARALTGLDRAEAQRLLYSAALRDGRLEAADLPEILEGKRHRVKEAGALDWIGADEGLVGLGGAETFKRWVSRRREAFGEKARRFGLDPPRGVLLVGVPGTGKSLACRAVAGEWHLPLLRLDAGRLYDRYVGASEANLRRALSTAEAMAPAVLWVDEVEKAVQAGGGLADDGLSQRMLGSLLTWMQERPAPVFVAATANDIGALPVELLRRGRFDEIFFFDLPDLAQRQRIFAIHLEHRRRPAAGFDLPALAAAAEGFSGAEIEGVVAAGLYHAFSEREPLSTPVLLAEITATRPLSRVRPQEMAALREWGREHAVTA